MQLKLVVEYDGTDYLGWQLQPDGPTVQSVLEQALATALREPVRVRVAGRTDAGVHACGQVVSVPVASVPEDLRRFTLSVNALTPRDIAVRDVSVVDDAFDPRRHARSRVYEYRLLTSRTPSAFWHRYAWHHPQPLDAGAMASAAAALLGEHDFTAFCAADADPMQSTVRRVLVSEVRRDGDLLVYRIEATAFLKHMVRNVVGTLVEIGRGERPIRALGDVLAGCDRRRAGATAPPHGLTLVLVRY
ncbi:MAG TPA: tRNA pseudouridine(38-40) synthase TruA [Candidatus Eisenbacteria bacterium]|nr:tRNA pseudouridine(38-40) synthase TruA [Candidatus Eisenbacteria bacterium]